jgi:hypothetical protein
MYMYFVGCTSYFVCNTHFAAMHQKMRQKGTASQENVSRTKALVGRHLTDVT